MIQSLLNYQMKELKPVLVLYLISTSTLVFFLYNGSFAGEDEGVPDKETTDQTENAQIKSGPNLENDGNRQATSGQQSVGQLLQHENANYLISKVFVSPQYYAEDENNKKNKRNFISFGNSSTYVDVIVNPGGPMGFICKQGPEEIQFGRQVDTINAASYRLIGEGLYSSSGGDGDKVPQWAADINQLKIRFLDSNNDLINPESQALNVSNEVTHQRLPKPTLTDWGTESKDPDNFRIEVIDPSANDEVSVTLKKNPQRKGSREYTLSNKNEEGFGYRSDFIRLVTDEEDASVLNWLGSHNRKQALNIKGLQTRLKAIYEKNGNKYYQNINVGRPKKEDNNAKKPQLRHDVRKLKVNVTVYTIGDNPVVSKSSVLEDLKVTEQRLAQSTIDIVRKIRTKEIPDEIGFSFKTSDELIIGDDKEESFESFTKDEQAVISDQDDRMNTIDVFYVKKISGKKAKAYPDFVNQTDKDSAQNFVVSSNDASDTPLVLAHELMHILLNSGHREEPSDPHTAVFNPNLDDFSLDWNGEKRIGPYSDAERVGVGVEDTKNIRENAENLPQN